MWIVWGFFLVVLSFVPPLFFSFWSLMDFWIVCILHSCSATEFCVFTCFCNPASHFTSLSLSLSWNTHIFHTWWIALLGILFPLGSFSFQFFAFIIHALLACKIFIEKSAVHLSWFLLCGLMFFSCCSTISLYYIFRRLERIFLGPVSLDSLSSSHLVSLWVLGGSTV